MNETYSSSSEINSKKVELEKPAHEYSILTLKHYEKRVTQDAGVKKPIEFVSDEKMRTIYIQRTSELIERILKEDCDTVIYLDKSARPVSLMVREMWDIFAPDKPKPDTKFANVDAHHWLNDSEARPETHEAHAMVIPQSVIQELQNAFKNEFYQKDENGNVLLNDSNQPIGKKVLIVDEISVTGSTLVLAKKMFEAAFPEVEFETKPWLQSTNVERGGRLIPVELPVWYHEKDVSGRFVGDIKEGSQIFSAPLEGTDPLSQALRADIKQMAIDIRSGKQAIRPSQDQDADELIYYYPGGDGKADESKPRYKIDYAPAEDTNKSVFSKN
jgi:hypothetical protein